MSVISNLELPVIQAPMAGGPSTPELVAAVNRGGGLGFLAGGYLTGEKLSVDISSTRELTDRPFGANVFVGGGSPAGPGVVDAYRRELLSEAEAAGIELGEPRFDDDLFDEKIDVLCAVPVGVVSFTFGLPPAEAVSRLRAAGSEIWLTVTSPDEAVQATHLGPDVLIVQGVEAGGHRGIFLDDGTGSELPLLEALRLIGEVADLQLVAAGGIADAGSTSKAMAAGAVAVQAGTAYLRSPEAGTSQVHRAAVASSDPTVLTRAFSGRLARGVENRFHRDHNAQAPHAYPEVHYLTSPLRAHGRKTGNGEVVNLWAGEKHERAEALPAVEITRKLAP